MFVRVCERLALGGMNALDIEGPGAIEVVEDGLFTGVEVVPVDP